MFHTSQLVALLSAMAMSVSAFGALYCLAQDRERVVFRVLALFMVASALSQVGTAIGPALAGLQAKVVVNALWITGVTSVAPLFWLYVRMLTSEHRALPRGLGWHFILPGLGAIAFIYTLLLPAETLLSLFPRLDEAPGIRGQFVGRSLEALLLPVPIQWAGYLAASSVLLVRYRARLKDLFASTEDKELRWIQVVMLLIAAYWLLQVGNVVFELVARRDGMSVVVEYLFNVVLAVVLALWGLRQRPGLPDLPATTDPGKRYAKSALDPEMAHRIADRLRDAMATDRVYLNPGLSLWSLARHASVSENYISQVLSEVIGKNFFDFVNGYRIAEAQRRLRETQDTILVIALDVGFNSRSSFYTAFRKANGVTPTDYRESAAVSAPPGQDA
jgi:AraC-like DNA-binding protein